MANALDMDLSGKVVIFKQEFMSVPAAEHPFLVDGGFGSSPHTHGHALSGTFLSDNERARMEGWMVERLATDEEIQATRTLRAPEEAK